MGPGVGSEGQVTRKGGRSVIGGDHVSKVWKPASVLPQIRGCGWYGVAYLYSREDAFKKFPKKTENQMRQTMGKSNQTSVQPASLQISGDSQLGSFGLNERLKPLKLKNTRVKKNRRYTHG